MAVDKPDLLQKKLCNATELVELLKLPSNMHNLTVIQELLCTGNVTTILQELYSSIKYEQFKTKVTPCIKNFYSISSILIENLSTHHKLSA